MPFGVSHPRQIIGIISEFMTAAEELVEIRPAVAIFGGSRVLETHPWYAKTVDMARQFSNAGFAVLSGGGPGIMEAANRGAYPGPAPSVGLNILLPNEQHINPYQNIVLNFQHFSTRKVIFFRHATAFVAAPGGYGTLDELAEILTLIQTETLPRVPVILLDSAFWGGLVRWLEKEVAGNGLIRPSDLDLIQLVDEPTEAVAAVSEFYHRTPG